MMKTVIICHSSHHKNTLTIAQAFSETLTADLKAPHEIDPVQCAKDYSIFGFGSGIYAGRHSRALLNLVDQMPPVQSKPAFVFSTCAGPKLFFYHTALIRRLRRKGFVIIGEFSARGFSTYGPLQLIGGIYKNRPNSRDIQNAQKCAEKIKTLRQ